MSAKYIFQLRREQRRPALPGKIVIGQGDTETTTRVLLKLLGYLLFFRDRLQIEARLDNDSIPFAPDLVQLDYELRPALWVECGECSVAKLDKLAVKVPEAEIWILKPSVPAAEHLLELMARHDLRRQRYGIIGLDADMFGELVELLRTRNEVFWFSGRFDPPQLQFDFNGLWFDAPFRVWRF
ncbi:MAG: YaeQ family protein [Verrucomicrobiota bacterium]